MTSFASKNPGMTPRRAAIVAYIGDYLREHGRSPTIREISLRFGMQINGAYGHLLTLRRLGEVDWDEGRARTIRLVGDVSPRPAGGAAPPEPPGLTARQSEALRVIAEGEARGRPLSLREIARAMGFGTQNGALTHIRALERKGVLHPPPPRSVRAIRTRRVGVEK